MILLLLLLLALAAAALYQQLSVGRYAIKSTKIQSKVTLCLITDLHSVWWGKDQSKLLRRISAMQPDLILLGGDIFDDKFSNAQPPVEALLKGICGMAPVFYVTGSHDIWTWRMAEWEKLLERYGVTVLHGETVPFDLSGCRLMITGVDEPAAAIPAGRLDEKAFYLEALAALGKLNAAHFNLLMAHRPEFIDDYARLGFDLVVSGHCHGGQVRIPLLVNGLYAPGQGIFPKYAAGLYQVKDTTLVVSRGLHFAWHLPRVFNRPEIVQITLSPDSGKKAF